MLATTYRLVFALGIIALAILTGIFCAWNPATFVEIKTPLTPSGDRYLLYLLLPGAVAAGALLSFFVMSAINISQGMSMRRTERELRDQLKEKNRQVLEADNRLTEYDAQTREFTLQVMQITHALGAPLKAPPGLALPQRHPGGADAGDES